LPFREIWTDGRTDRVIPIYPQNMYKICCEIKNVTNNKADRRHKVKTITTEGIKLRQ